MKIEVDMNVGCSYTLLTSTMSSTVVLRRSRRIAALAAKVPPAPAPVPTRTTVNTRRKWDDTLTLCNNIVTLSPFMLFIYIALYPVKS